MNYQEALQTIVKIRLALLRERAALITEEGASDPILYEAIENAATKCYELEEDFGNLLTYRLIDEATADFEAK